MNASTLIAISDSGQEENEQLSVQQIQDLFLKTISKSASIIKTLIPEKKDPKWLTEKDENGEILLRFSSQPISFIVKSGSKFFFFEGYLAQNHIGNSKFGNTYYEWYTKQEIKSEILEPQNKYLWKN